MREPQTTGSAVGFLFLCHAQLINSTNFTNATSYQTHEVNLFPMLHPSNQRTRQQTQEKMTPDENTPLATTTTTTAPNNAKLGGGFPTMAALLRKGAILENRGSTARDHLANERTYLAWMRTGLALIGASLGLLKWSEISDTEGYLVAFMGIVVLVMATCRYFRNMQLLEGGFFAPNVHGILLVITVVIAAIVAAFALQFQNRPKQ